MNLDEMKTKILDCMGTSALTGEEIWKRFGSPDDSFLLDSALVQLQKDPRVRIIRGSGDSLLRYQRI